MKQHSTEQINWETKLRRIMLKSCNNKELEFNNLGHVIDIDMLHSCYESLEGSKARGIDKVSKEEYAEKLAGNLTNLLCKIRRGTYKPQATRMVEIPKSDGGLRPLSISCFEDKIVFDAVRRILHCIFEPIFEENSHGFRQNRNCHTALQVLNKQLMDYKTGAVLDVDIKQCFNTINHGKLIEILSSKIKDKRFLNLIIKLIKMESLDNLGQIIKSSMGTPQGSILSPLLCNIFLDEVVDKWIRKLNVKAFAGQIQMVRYADDMVFVTSGLTSAEKLKTLLSDRLREYGLELHPDKTKVIKCGQKEAFKILKRKEKFPTFDFLGFTHVWCLSMKRKTKEMFARIKLITSGRRFRKSLKMMKEFIKKNRHSCSLIQEVKQRVVGYLNYFAINDNGRRINNYVYEVERMLFKWLNRRSQKMSVNWEQFNRVLRANNFPKPKILHNLFFNGKNYGKT